jgi:LysR family hydrogen peroxide-inducible transcriptional activator
MEMHQLRYFVAVAHTGSFSRAAEKQIQKLEQNLRHRLFDRLGRRAVLTDAGRLLLERAEAILETVDDAEWRLRSADGFQGGRLRVGAIPTIAPYLLPWVLPRFLKQHPKVELTIQEDVTLNQEAAI